MKGAQESLKRQDGVQDIQIEYESGEVEITARPGESLNPQAINENVENMGYTPSHVVITATGMLRSGADGWRFRIGELDYETDVTALSKDGKEPESGRAITLSATVHFNKEGIRSLELLELIE